MTSFEHVTDEIKLGWTRLADRVCEELHLAGLPARRILGSENFVGAKVIVDAGADDGGGVFVSWSVDPRLIQAAMHSMESDNFEHSVVLHSGAIAFHMHTAIVEILKSAGFSVEPSPDDMRPYSARINS